MLFRHLPDYYPTGSAYAHFPFYVPEFIKEALTKLDNPDISVEKYNWSRPEKLAPIVAVDSYDKVSKVLTDPKNFVSEQEPRLSELTDDVLLDHGLVSANGTAPW